MKPLRIKGVARAKGFSQAVLAPWSSDARFVFISGQKPRDSSGRTVGAGNFEAQVVQTFENLKRCLKAANATFDDLVKLTIYVVPMDEFETVRRVRRRYLNPKKLPSITSVRVTSLVDKDWLIEIEAMAEVKAS